MTPAPLRVGLIGAGRWAPALVRTLASLPDWRLDRIARAREMPLEFAPQIECVTDWRRIAHAPDLDAAIIASPPHLHAEMARACVENGLAVFVEKPLTLSAPEAESLLARTRQQPVPFFVDHVNLFNPAFRTLCAVVAEHPLLAVESESGSPLDKPVHDYGALWDWGSHDVAMMLTLAQGRTLRDARAVRAEGRAGERETIDLHLAFADGLTGLHRVSTRSPERRRRLKVVLPDCALLFDDMAEDKLVRIRLGEREVIPYSPEPPLRVALREFGEAIRAGNRDLAQLELGVDVVRILAACEATLP